MERRPFTGERLHEDQALFGVDLVRHRAAYAFARERARGVGRVLDLGCGTGYGTHELSGTGAWLLGVDRVAPTPASRAPDVHYLRADLERLPLRAAGFDLVVSFQVIEHLPEPGPYLAAIARLLRPGGSALLSTPNALQSDGENPFHVHEYEAEELEALLRDHFERVEMLGVGVSSALQGYFDARLQRIRRIVALDPLGLRRRLPRPLLHWLFARAAVLVRRLIRRGNPAALEATLADFPIAPADPRCLDLLAVCRVGSGTRGTGA